MEKISIYQVFTRLFGVKNPHPIFNGSYAENGSGKMADFTNKALSEIKKLGVTHIWYTGIIQHATCESFKEQGIKGQNPRVVKGKAGSPYAITDYYDVNPYLAKNIHNRMKEFELLINRTHKNQLKAIIDFVPNHVARQYASDIYSEKDFGRYDDTTKGFSAKNDYYYLNGPINWQEEMGTNMDAKEREPFEEIPAKATGNDLFSEYPTINDWYETVKLNYGVNYFDNCKTYFDPIPPLWDKMVDILRFWAQKKVDAFRCDMAEMVPVEFWNYAIGIIKKEFPHIQFIAEVYNPELYNSYLNIGKFDYLYDKVGLYDKLRSIIQHNASASLITECWQALEGNDEKMLRFIENHDEHRFASNAFAGNMFFAKPAMVVCATLNKGPVMTYFGQELGEPAAGATGYSGDDGKTTIFDFYNVPEFQKWYNSGKFNEVKLSSDQIKLRTFYKRLLNATIQENCFSSGQFYDLMWVNNFNGGPDTSKIYAYLRYTLNETILVLVNFDKKYNHTFKLKIPEHAIDLLPYKLNTNIHAQDLLNESNNFNFNARVASDNGIIISIEANEGCLFKLNPI